MNRISELRKAKKLSQLALGKILGAAQNTISQWENGTREIDVKTSYALAEYFSVSVDYLLGHDEQQKKSTVEDDGLSDRQRAFVESVRSMSPEDLDLLESLMAVVKKQKE